MSDYNVANPIFLQQLFEQLVAKVRSPITNNGPRGAKSRKYVLFQELSNTLLFIIRKSDSFYPFWHIIDCCNNVHYPMRTYKKSHKFNAPHIKKIQSQEWDLKEALAFSKCHHLFHIYHMPWQTHEYLGGWLANSIHIARSCE